MVTANRLYIQTEKIQNINTDSRKSSSNLRPPPAKRIIMVLALLTYGHIPPPACRGNYKLHIPAGPHSECGTKDTHTSTESHYYTNITHIASNPYRKQMTATGRVHPKSKGTNLNTDCRKCPSSLRPPPARHIGLASYTYVHIPPIACRGNNDLHIPAGPHCEYGTREIHTSTESHYYTDITQIVSNPYRKQITVTRKYSLYLNRKDTKSYHRR